MRRLGLRAALLVVLLAVLAGAFLPALRAWRWRRESNPVRRGALLAARVGCLACHGPDGTRGLPDPGLAEEVPSWDGGVPMMYVSGPDEVREFILDGVSRRRAASAGARAERERAAIRMPAYRALLDATEVEDLVAYFMAASGMEPMDDPAAARGRELVRQHRCEACHGVAGSGSVANPGSFTGYVPGWIGGDFAELVRDGRELEQWVLDGRIERFTGDRLARYFLGRQRLQMPAYRGAITPDGVRDIGAWIERLRGAAR